jgi:hypothetical protein
LHAFFPTPIHATCPTRLILLHLVTQIIFVKVCKSLSSSLCSFLQSPFNSSPIGPVIFFNTLFSNFLSQLSSLNVKDHIIPYKTMG